jgi:hypothetical protein
LSASLSATLAADFSKGNGVRVSSVYGSFKRTAVHLLTDGAFYDFAGDLHKISLLA